MIEEDLWIQVISSRFLAENVLNIYLTVTWQHGNNRQNSLSDRPGESRCRGG